MERTMFKNDMTLTHITTTEIDIEKYIACDPEVIPKTLSAFIKNSIGYDYYSTYKNYFDNLFNKCEKNIFYSDENDYDFLINVLYNKLIDIKSIYTKGLSIDNQTVKNGLRSKALLDVEIIMMVLFKLEKNNNAVDSNDFNRFYKKLKLNIMNTNDKMLPRSIVNFSAFKFCIPGYPYETKSGKIYSISNVCTEDIIEKIKIYHKNIDALITFINDIEIPNETDDHYEFNILKLSYGVLISLIAISAEETEYEAVLRKHYGTRRN